MFQFYLSIWASGTFRQRNYVCQAQRGGVNFIAVVLRFILFGCHKNRSAVTYVSVSVDMQISSCNTFTLIFQ